MAPKRVLVCDDSFFMRTILSDILSSSEEIVVAGTAKNGREAVEKTMSLRPDVITMDLDMPEVDGLEALKRIMDARPTPVIVVSAHATEGAELTLKALEMGALEFVTKPQVGDSTHMPPDRHTLIEKVLVAAGADMTKHPIGPGAPRSGLDPETRQIAGEEDVLVILGASAGGPRALMEVFRGLPSGFKSPVAVIQHMPSGFTHSLASRLDAQGGIPVRQAMDGDRLRPGMALVAPGGEHMEITIDALGPRIVLSDGQAVHGVKPCIDVFVKSAVGCFPGAVLIAVLSGMGKDGTEGAGLVRDRGGRVLAQDESTSAIYGMPKAVAEAGFVDRCVPIQDMAREIMREIGSMKEGGT